MSSLALITKRRVCVAGCALALAAAAALAPRLLLGQAGRGLAGLEGASPTWLVLAGAFFVAALGCSAGAWRAAFTACGGHVTAFDASARYAVGSLVNSLTPARLGDVVRIRCFASTLTGPARLWTAGGVFAAIGIARWTSFGVLLGVAGVLHAIPLLPLLVVAACVAAGGILCIVSRDLAATRPVSHLFDGFRAFGRSPGIASRVCGWALAATAARLAAAGCVGAALGVPRPLEAALIVVPALEVAGILPLTPGNLGVASGAVAVALRTQGVGMSTAVASGLALHGVETLVSLSVGLFGALALAPVRVRRLVSAFGTAGLAATVATVATLVELDAM